MVDDGDGLGPTAGAAQTIDAGDRECYAYSPKALQGLAASGHPFRVSLRATAQARSPCSCRKCVPLAGLREDEEIVIEVNPEYRHDYRSAKARILLRRCILMPRPTRGWASSGIRCVSSNLCAYEAVAWDRGLFDNKTKLVAQFRVNGLRTNACRPRGCARADPRKRGSIELRMAAALPHLRTANLALSRNLDREDDDAAEIPRMDCSWVNECSVFSY